MKTITKKEIKKRITCERKGFSNWFYTYTDPNTGETIRENNYNGTTMLGFIDFLYVKLQIDDYKKLASAL